MNVLYCGQKLKLLQGTFFLCCFWRPLRTKVVWPPPPPLVKISISLCCLWQFIKERGNILIMIFFFKAGFVGLIKYLDDGETVCFIAVPPDYRAVSFFRLWDSSALRHLCFGFFLVLVLFFWCVLWCACHANMWHTLVSKSNFSYIGICSCRS